MLDLQNSVLPLTEFKQNSSEILSYIKKTHNPAILTVNGRAEAVVLDTASYQKMMNKISLLESANQIKASLMEMENDQGISAKKGFQRLRKKISQKSPAKKKSKT